MTRILLLLALGLTAIGQTNEEPYFALQSNATFAVGEQPKVDLTSVDTGTLEFRVYKVNDPVAFFGKLEDPHQFGGRAPKPPLQKSFLETFHRTKHALRVDAVQFLHDQFSMKTIAAYQAFRTPKVSGKGGGAVEFATPPLLNPQQLVAAWKQSVATKGRFDTAPVNVPVKEKGVYLVEATRGQLRAFTILMITDLAMVAKTSGSTMQVFVADRQSGAPIADARVLLTEKERTLEAKTDANGIAALERSQDRGEPQLLVVKGPDFAANSVPNYGDFGDDWQRYRGMIYTDRPVYRPGHRVYFKGLFREKFGAAFGLPKLKEVEVEINGADSGTVYSKTLPLTGFGTVSGDFVLPANASLGSYSIHMKLGRKQEYESFEVQEYKKPEYEVRVTPARKRILQGEKFEAVIDARYFFGEPVANAKVKYSLHKYRYYSPLLWDQSEFENDGDDQPYNGDDAQPGYVGEEAEEHTATLDADGKLTVSLPIPLDGKAKADYVYSLGAEVTDAGNRAITGTAGIVATYGSFLIRVTPEQYFANPGKPVGLNIAAIDYDGNPVRTSVDITVNTWGWRQGFFSKTVATLRARTDAKGQGRVDVNLPAGELFRVLGTARTPEGRGVQNETYIYGTIGRTYETDSPRPVRIVPDKKKYQPGDTAHILLISGRKNGTILASLEGRTLGKPTVLSAPDGTATFDVKITEDHVPDFYIQASSLSENRMYQGQKRISVPADARQLNVKITPSKAQYIPGEAAEYTIEAKDAAGKGVSSEVSLGIVDEAIYGVRPDTTPAMLGIFYPRGYNSVQTSDSLAYYFHGEAGRRRMELARLHQRKALAQLKPERLVLPKVRKFFPDTVLWQPTLMTDANGIAKTKLTFPDSVTTFRATARAITMDTKVGSAIQKTIVRKNIILRLVMPRFFVQGDEVTVSAVVHNYLATEKKAKISIDVTGLESIEGTTREVTIPTKGEVKLDWRVRAKILGTATITGKALTDEESDAVEMSAPVEPAGVKLTDARNGSLVDSGSTDIAMALPAALVPQSQSLEIHVAPSVAGALFGAVNYLTDFPYGCTEQTLSSFVPNAVVARALRNLGIKSDVNPADLQAKMKAGLDRLKDYQHPDGGWGWWKTDDSSIFMTSAAVAGLSQAREAGLPVPDAMTMRGSRWLKKSLAETPKLAGDLQAYTLYALTLNKQADAALVAATVAKKSDMTSYGLAMLGLATRGTPEAATITKQLESTVKIEGDEAYWAGDRDNMLDLYLDTGTETTAQVLRVLIQNDKASPLIPKAVVWLLNHRREGAWWYSTKQTAMVIYGLTDYLGMTGELKADLAVTVSVNGKKLAAKTYGPEDALKAGDTVIQVAAVDLTGKTNTVRVDSEGKGRLYWSVKSTYSSSEPKLAKTGNLKLNLLRDYFKLTPTRQGDRVVHQLSPINGPLTVGDVMAVRITVTGDDWRYLLVEDPIPAGFEFIEDDGKYTLDQKPDWWNSWYSRREFHDDRAAIFQTFFRSGQQQYVYLLKVVNPGLFHANPAKVWPMYQPSIFSTSEASTVVVSTGGAK